MMTLTKRATLPVTLALLLAACGGEPEASNAVAGNTTEEAGHGEAEGEHKGEAAEGAIVLTPRQIAAAGIQIVRPNVTGGGGVLTLPATIEGDPQGTQVVSAAIGGRVVSLTRNLGQSIGRGQTLAQLALSWVLRHPGITSALIGASSVEQLEQNVAAAGAPALTDDELAAIEPLAVDGTGR